MKIDYARQTLETPNPVARFAHKKRYKLSVVSALSALREGGSLLDYGCGKGHFLDRIVSLRQDAKLYGYDPESRHASEAYQVIDSTSRLEGGRIDVICCFEVLEHLYAHEKEQFYSEASRLLSDSGRIIISVPVIGGPTVLLKEMNRAVLFRRGSDYSPKELFLASFFGIPATRPDNPRVTHKGFDFGDIEKELRGRFLMQKKEYCPFPVLPWYMNSQVFFTCVKRE